jgi:formylglycine-generating enzyme required for sulfatase activity
METVTVGNPGNTPDTRYETPGYGGIAYAYNIGTFEVTATQYAEFLNAVAATDTYGLYNERMGDPSTPYFLGCNIQRSGSPGSYSYTVAPDWANRPVNFVSWADAARFANWLHKGQPGLNTPVLQDDNSTEQGAYDLSATQSYYGPDGQKPDTGSDDWHALVSALAAVVREPHATWVIPSEDEWYKAAYHYNDGVTGNYYDYPTSSDSVPSSDLVDPDPGNNATFNGSSGPTIGGPYYRTEAGAHENSESPYGTFDQGGNVWEWNEAIFSAWLRGLRGGGFSSDARYYLHAAYPAGGDPLGELDVFGFRVAEVPEPATLGLLAVGAAAVLRRKRS